MSEPLKPGDTTRVRFSTTGPKNGWTVGVTDRRLGGRRVTRLTTLLDGRLSIETGPVEGEGAMLGTYSSGTRTWLSFTRFGHAALRGIVVVGTFLWDGDHLTSIEPFPLDGSVPAPSVPNVAAPAPAGRRTILVRRSGRACYGLYFEGDALVGQHVRTLGLDARGGLVMHLDPVLGAPIRKHRGGRAYLMVGASVIGVPLINGFERTLHYGPGGRTIVTDETFLPAVGEVVAPIEPKAKPKPAPIVIAHYPAPVKMTLRAGRLSDGYELTISEPNLVGKAVTDVAVSPQGHLQLVFGAAGKKSDSIKTVHARAFIWLAAKDWPLPQLPDFERKLTGTMEGDTLTTWGPAWTEDEMLRARYIPPARHRHAAEAPPEPRNDRRLQRAMLYAARRLIAAATPEKEGGLPALTSSQCSKLHQACYAIRQALAEGEEAIPAPRPAADAPTNGNGHHVADPVH